MKKVLGSISLLVLMFNTLLTPLTYAEEYSEIVETSSENAAEEVLEETGEEVAPEFFVEENTEEDMEENAEDEEIDENEEIENSTGDIVEELSGDAVEIGSGDNTELITGENSELMTGETIELATGDITEVLTGDVEESSGTGEETIVEEIKYNEEPIIGEKTYDDVTVKVEALSGTFPEGTELNINPIRWWNLWNLKDKLVEEKEEIKKDATVVAFDITFIYEGEEVQPKDGEKVKVTFDYSNNKNLLKADNDESKSVKVYHIEDKDSEGNELEKEEQRIIEVTNKEESTENGIAVADADSFSVYLLTYGNEDPEFSAILIGDDDDRNNNFHYKTITISDGEHTYTLMDRNLGARVAWDTGTHAFGTDYSSNYNTASDFYGYYYQWGNNYGFSAKTTSINVGEVISNVIPSNYVSKKWFTYNYPTNYNLRGNTTNTESARQGPCPRGWHVPSADEWEAIRDAWCVSAGKGEDCTAGQAFAEALQMPTAGFRFNTSVSSRSNGFYWSSTSNNNSNAIFLLFNWSITPKYTPASDDNTYKRTTGFPVRCLMNNSDAVTLYLNLNGGSIENGIIDADAQGKVTLPTATRDGYVFEGWYDAVDGGNRIGGSGNEITIETDTDLYAHWASIPTFDVIFNNGANVTKFEVDDGLTLTNEQIQQVSNLTHTKATFDGWYTNPEFTQAFDFNTPITEDTALYAKWTCNEGYITLQGNGGPDMNCFEYGTISYEDNNGNEHVLMDRNLGAQIVGFGYDADSKSYGYYYQWGNNYGFGPYTTPITSNTQVDCSNINPSSYSSSTFIIGSNDFDWCSSRNDNLWGGSEDGSSNNRGLDIIPTTAVARQGPCPKGWHVPSIGERQTLLIYWASGNNMTGVSGTPFYDYSLDSINYTKFQNDFKIPIAGQRAYEGAQFVLAGGAGSANLWSSSPNVDYGWQARGLNLNNDAWKISANQSSIRAYGRSVRCFMNITTKTLVLNANGGTTAENILETDDDGKVTLPIATRDADSNGERVFEGWFASSGVSEKIGNSGDEITLIENVTLYAHWAQTISIDRSSGISEGSVGFTILDRNLGAIVPWDGTWNGNYNVDEYYGYYYQRGNNHGFLYNIPAEPYNGPATIKLSDIPSKFSSDIWDTTTWNPGNNIWGDEYDTDLARQGPCPQGYHVPSSGEWQAIYDVWENSSNKSNSESSASKNFVKDLKLPPAGFLTHTYEDNNRGSTGFYWSSTPKSSSEAYSLEFDSESILDPQAARSSIYGHPVRCFKNNPKNILILNAGSGTVDLGDGAQSTVTTGIVKGKSFIVPIPIRINHDFDGWFVDKNSNGKYDEGEEMKGDAEGFTIDFMNANLTLTAKWKVTVTFDADGGISDKASDSGQPGDIITLPGATQDGKEFSGWVNSGDNYVGTSGDNYTLSIIETLKALWYDNVVFFVYANGERAANPIFVNNGGNITLPSVSSVSGYTFDGWYDQAVGGNKIGYAGNELVVNGSMTLYVQGHYDSVELVDNNTTTTVGSDDAADEVIGFPITMTVTENTILESSEGKELSEVEGKEIAGDVTIDFGGKDAKFSRIVKVNIPVKGSSKAYVKVKHVSSENYNYDGLTRNIEASCNDGNIENSDHSYDGEYMDVVNGYVSIYTCEASSFLSFGLPKVTFIPNNGGEPIVVEVESGATVNNEDIPNLSNSEDFLGWYADNGTFLNEFDFDTVITGDITLYAKWQSTVTFDTDGGIPVPEPQTVAIGAYATQPETNPTKTGYIFTGWYQTGSDTDFDFEHISITGNMILYAKYSCDLSNGFEDKGNGVCDCPNEAIQSGNECVVVSNEEELITIDSPSPLTGDGPVSLIIMDRNLGATMTGFGAEAETGSYGYFYQWGNSYGFDYMGDFETTGSLINVSGKTYYSGNVMQCSNASNWMTPVSFNFWGGEGGQGPCPEGWHVPTSSEYGYLYGYYIGEAGASSSTIGFLERFNIPYMGYYNVEKSACVFAGAGTEANLWSSTLKTNANKIYTLSVKNGQVLTQKESSSAYAKPVRCFRDYVTVSFVFFGPEGVSIPSQVVPIGGKAVEPRVEGYSLAFFDSEDDIGDDEHRINFSDPIPANKEIYVTLSEEQIFNLTYDYNGGSLDEGLENPDHYSNYQKITLHNPKRDSNTHFTFIGWIGTGLNDPMMEVTIPRGSVGDRSYKALYTCDYGYIENNEGECVEISDSGIKYDLETQTITVRGNVDGSEVRYTIQDRNVGATETGAYNVYTDAARGKYYQYGNNNGLYKNDAHTFLSSAVDVGNIEPSTYYGNLVKWDGPFPYVTSNGTGYLNLWGYYSETNDWEARRGPCPLGYHVPSDTEFTNIIKALGSSTRQNTLSQLRLPGVGWGYSYNGKLVTGKDCQEQNKCQGKYQQSKIDAPSTRYYVKFEDNYNGKIESNDANRYYPVRCFQDYADCDEGEHVNGFYCAHKLTFNNSGSETSNLVNVIRGVTVEPEEPERAGYNFEGWYENLESGDEFEFGNALSEDVILYAKWNKIGADYDVEVEIIPFTGGNVTGTGVYSEGDVITLTATPNEGYHFTGWYDESDNLVSNNNPYIFTADASDGTGLKAVFELKQYAVSVQSNDTNKGIITYPVGPYTHGMRVVFSPSVTNPLYKFFKWSLNGNDVLTGNNKFLTGDLIIESVTGNVNVIGYFTGYDSCSFNNQIIQHGQSVTGYKASSVTCPNSCESQQATCNNGSWNVENFVENYKSSTCTHNEYSCGEGFTLDTCPAHGICSEPCTPYTVNENACVPGTQKVKLINCVEGYHIDNNKCTANEYAVIFDANGGEGTMAQDTATYGSDYTFNNSNFTKEGSTFSGWNTKADKSGTRYYSGQQVHWSFTGNLTLYAQWKVNTYTVTFDANSGEVAPTSKTVTYDATYGELPVPTRTGYTFTGWYTAKVDGTSVTGTDTVEITADQTLYAHWEANTYTVRYKANGGEGEDKVEQATYDEKYVFATNAFTRTGYTFVEWNTKADGEGASYAEGFSGTWKTTTGVNLYAIWSENSYTVAYQGGEGAEGTVTGATYRYTENFTLAANAFTKNGYTFSGWRNGENHYSAGAELNGLTAINNDTITFTAEWNKDTYTISYNYNNGTGTANPTSYDVDDSFTLNNPIRTGYTFIGWSGTDLVGSGNKEVIINSGSTGNRSYEANWEANTYTVTYKANGGEGDDVIEEATYDEHYEFVANTFSREGNTFVEWNTKANGEGAGYAEGFSGTWKTTTGVVLYAKWNINSYTVTYDAASHSGTIDGQATSGYSIEYNTQITLPTSGTSVVVSDNGYDFIGWTTTLGGIEPIGNTYRVKGDVTFYPIFKKAGMKKDITFHKNGNNGYIYSGKTYNEDNTFTGCEIPTLYNTDPYTGSCSVHITLADIIADANTPIVLGWSTGEAERTISYGTGEGVTIVIPENKEVELYAQTKSEEKEYTATYATDSRVEEIAKTPDVCTISATYNGESQSTACAQAIILPNLVAKNGYHAPVWMLGEVEYTGGAEVVLSGNVIFTGTATPDAQTPYIVKHYYQSGDSKYYELNGTDNLSGRTENVLTLSALQKNPSENTGFTYLNSRVNSGAANVLDIDQIHDFVTDAEIQPGLVIQLFYTRNTNPVTMRSVEHTTVEITPEKGNYYYGEQIILSGEADEGYTFSGWNIKEGENEAQIVLGDRINYSMPSTGVDVTPVIREHSYRIVYDANGGEGSLTGVTTLYSNTVTLPTSGDVEGQMEKTGYHFVGWTTGATETTVIETLTRATSVDNGEITLYAKWAPNNGTQYVVKYYQEPVEAGHGEEDYVLYAVYTGMAQTMSEVTGDQVSYNGFQTPSAKTGIVVPDGSLVINYYYTRNSYNYMFNAGLGAEYEDGTEAKVLSFRYGQTVSLPVENLVKTGYTQLGWTPAVLATMPYVDTVTTAEWTVNHYTISYNANSGTGTMPSQTNVAYNESIQLTGNQFTKTGYTFTGWSKTTDGAVEYKDKALVSKLEATNNATVTLYAQWSAENYTVTFDANSGEVIPTTIEVTYDATYGELPTPNRTGYTFQGWYTAKEGGTKVISSTQVKTANYHTLYAHWTENHYTIAFNANGGEGTMASITNIPYSESTTLTENVFTRNGYRFVGWARISTSTVKEFNDKAIVKELTGENNAIVTLYALWSKGSYKIDYVLNGGALTGGKTNLTGYDVDTASFTLNNPERDGYKFIGWSGTAIDGLSGTVIVAQGSTGDRVYEANWEVKTYTINYELNTGALPAGQTNPATYTIESEDITLINPIRTGYDFNGWSGTAIEGTGNTVTITHGSTGDRKYEANWKVKTYTVTWKNSTGTVLKEEILPYGATPDYGGTPTSGADAQYTYTFAGWEPEITPVTEDQVYTATYNKTLNTYIITFKNEDGTVLYTTGVAYGNTPVFSGTDPQKAADAQYTYTFNGWSPALAPVTGEATYTATYTHTINKYTITFVDENGSELKAGVKYDYGTVSGDIAQPDEPIKTGDAHYSYTFKGWNPELTGVTKDQVYTAVYDQTINSYPITFYDEDGTTILQGPTLYPYGTLTGVIVPVFTPTKASDGTYNYTFKGWTPEIETVVGTANYTATYESSYIDYQVIFLDSTGAVLTSGYYHSGDNVVIPTGPAKASTAQTGYTFKSWYPEVQVVTGEITYEPTYTETTRSYTIIWKDRNGIELEKDENVLYGTNPVYDSNDPTSGSTAQYVYTFNGWSPGVHSVTGPEVYTAVYKNTLRSYPITFYDEDGITVVKSSTMYPYGTPSTTYKPVTNPTKEGYSFEKWIPDLEVVVGTADYKASYKINSYKVTPVKGVGIADIIGGGTYEYNTVVTLTGYAKAGYHFEGGETVKGFNVTVPANSISVKITAIPNTYYVRYNPGDGTGVMLDQEFLYDQEKELNANTYTNEGLYFKEWTDGVGHQYKNKAKVKNLATTGVVDLFAIWTDTPEPIPPTPSPTPTPGESAAGGGRSIPTEDEHESADLQTGAIVQTGNDDVLSPDVVKPDDYSITGTIVNTGGDSHAVTGYTTRTQEEMDAYKYAYKYSITTLAPREAAMPDEYVQRGHMAKMVVNYALNVLHRKLPDKLPKQCKWKDGRNAWESQEIKDYAEKACALGLMGIDMDYFQPNKLVTRAQFGTIFGRLLRGKLPSTPYYAAHLTRLKEEGIMTQIENPEDRIEIRKWAWLMFMRSEKYFKI